MDESRKEAFRQRTQKLAALSDDLRVLLVGIEQDLSDLVIGTQYLLPEPINDFWVGWAKVNGRWQLAARKLEDGRLGNFVSLVHGAPRIVRVEFICRLDKFYDGLLGALDYQIKTVESVILKSNQEIDEEDDQSRG